jgi:proton-dependent oligopeptide transporter, POT family
LIPLFSHIVYPLIQRCGIQVTDLRKMGAGLLCTGLSLVVAGVVQLLANNKHTISVFWIIPQFFLVSCGEILLSVTVYEFAYTQAPKSMKGLLTALWLVTVAIGNAIVALINIANLGASAIMYFVLAGLMVIVFGIFVLIARKYQYVEEDGKNIQ